MALILKPNKSFTDPKRGWASPDAYGAVTRVDLNRAQKTATVSWGIYKDNTCNAAWRAGGGRSMVPKRDTFRGADFNKYFGLAALSAPGNNPYKAAYQAIADLDELDENGGPTGAKIYADWQSDAG